MPDGDVYEPVNSGNLGPQEIEMLDGAGRGLVSVVPRDKSAGEGTYDGLDVRGASIFHGM